MAKFSGNTKNLIRVPLASLIDGDNVRRVYDADEISQLANSILRDGLLSPLVVNSGVENAIGFKNYVVICGHRRLRALKKLAEDGNDVGLVECVIRAGDTWTMQMVENVQRVDLSPAEKEAAVRQMIDAGMSQTEIAERVSKPLSWVSDILAGGRVREAAENAGVDTSGISTRALSQLRSVPDEQVADAVQELRDAGGSVKAATEILHEKKDEWTGQQRLEDSVEDDEEEEDATTHVSSDDSTGDTASGDAFDVFEEEEGESESESDTTQHDSSWAAGRVTEEIRYNVYGCFRIGKRHQQLELDGIYNIEMVRQLRDWLKEHIPVVEWMIYDNLKHETAE